MGKYVTALISLITEFNQHNQGRRALVRVNQEADGPVWRWGKLQEGQPSVEWHMKTPEGLSDCEDQDSLVWWNQDWTVWPQFLSIMSGQIHQTGNFGWRQCHSLGVFFSSRDLVQTAQDLTLGWKSTFQQDTHPKHGTGKALNPIKHLWSNLKMALYWWSPSSITEWQKIPKSCAKLVASLRLTAKV